MKRLFFAIILLISISPLVAREVINLNRGWQFTPGWEVNKGKYTEINLPHTYNLDALSGKQDYYRGLANYVKTLEIPVTWRSDKVFLRFKGVNQTADLYVNSKHVGQHKGGYTAFGWDITPFLRFGERNTLWVRVNNAPDLDVMPLVGDFNMYGGIYRDVEMIVVPKTHIDLENFGSFGVFVTQNSVNEEKAEITVTTTVTGDPNDNAEVKLYLRDEQKQILDSVVRRVRIENDGDTEISRQFTINNPHLWNGTIDPYMYNVLVEVKSTKTGSRADFVEQNFGVRYWEVNKDNQFTLNGKPYKIQGVAKHQDYAGLGNAVNRLNHERDMELMLEMGVNAVRLAHYPYDSYFIELCDKNGIIVWSEIPFVGPGGYRDKGFNDSEAFMANGKQQLVEMIRQHYNHPSILFWGLFNELIQQGDDPAPYVRELNELAKEEDPSRLTVAASNQDGDLNFITDLIAFNKYFGWYGGMPADLEQWGRTLRRDWAKLLVGISEYGAGSSIYHQQDTLMKTIPTSYWHPENWQTHFHEEHWKIIKDKPYFWGTFVWAMFDFGAAHRTEGQLPGVNDKGLVTFDRAIKKDAFYFYKANWNKEDPFVYIAERRNRERSSPVQTIKIYSNQEQVDVTIDGTRTISLKSDGYGTFLWKDVELGKGEHTVEVVTAGGSRDSVTFTIK